jgi:hypothetical protein
MSCALAASERTEALTKNKGILRFSRHQPPLHINQKRAIPWVAPARRFGNLRDDDWPG